MNEGIWSTNISNDCGSTSLNNAFQDFSLVTTGEIALLPGVYFGLLQQTKSFGGMTRFLRPEK